MKIALITDLHANREAFEAVLADARAWGCDQLALLGDFVGYGGDPAWLLSQVQPLVRDGAIAVLGNHDQAVALGALPSMREDARLAVEWTRSQLSAEQLEFLAQLPLSARLDNCLFVHANAFAPAEFEYIQGRAEAVRSMQATQSIYTFCGHMHEPMLYHLSGTGKAGEFTPVPGIEIPLMANRQWLVVPGACGQPRDGNPAACYARFDTQTALLSFQRIPYDHEAAAARILASGLPPAVAQRLADRLNQGT
ncbi:MAG: metallophosphatase family protein [Methylibium sp.]|nr:metallophosphatase family protein [Methylibium sp.]